MLAWFVVGLVGGGAFGMTAASLLAARDRERAYRAGVRATALDLDGMVVPDVFPEDWRRR